MRTDQFGSKCRGRLHGAHNLLHRALVGSKHDNAADYGSNSADQDRGVESDRRERYGEQQESSNEHTNLREQDDLSASLCRCGKLLDPDFELLDLIADLIIGHAEPTLPHSNSSQVVYHQVLGGR